MAKQKKAIISGIVCTVTLAMGIILAMSTLRSLGEIFGSLSSLLGEETANTMCAIFTQTQDATIRPHVLIPVLCAALQFWLCYRTHTRLGIVFCVLATVLTLLITYLSALFLSCVNDIRFIDLVLSLAESISDGLFDSM